MKALSRLRPLPSPDISMLTGQNGEVDCAVESVSTLSSSSEPGQALPRAPSNSAVTAQRVDMQTCNM